MRIALVITGLGVGGAERVVADLADHFAERGHDVLLAFLTGAPKVLPSHTRVKVVGVGMTSYRNVVTAYFTLRRVLVSFRPDVVHSHMVHANILCRLVRLTAKIPVLISTAHSSNEGGRGRMLAYRLTDRFADISTNVSEAAVVAFVSMGAVRKQRMVAVHNGVPTDKFRFSATDRNRIRSELGISETSKLIVAVGRLTEAKDYPNLLNALRQLALGGQEFNACIVGDGPLRGLLEKLTTDYELSSRVRFLGLRQDIPAIMSAADVFVLSSAWEGFGLVLAEAMCCERVVVATDIGGVSEVVGQTQMLVPPCDSMALAQVLQKALSLSAADSEQIGRDGRVRVLNKYSIDSIVARWLDIYSSFNRISTI